MFFVTKDIFQISNKQKIISKFSSYNNVTNAEKNISDALNNQAFGQPVHSTHPHIVNKDELVPGLKVEEFQQRRARLLNGVQKYAADYLKEKCGNRNHLVCIPSGVGNTNPRLVNIDRSNYPN